MLVQTMENVEDLPSAFKEFLENNLESDSIESLGIIITKIVKAVLQVYPGLYRDTISAAL